MELTAKATNVSLRLAKGSPVITSRRWTLLAIAATAVVILLCLTPKAYVPPGEALGSTVPHQDKIAHVILFAGFGICWAMAVRKPGRFWQRGAIVLVAGIALGIGTELAQGIPIVNRDPDVLDAVADIAGAILGIVCSRIRW